MSDEKIERSFTGNRFTIVHCNEAIESFEEALSHVTAKKAKTFKRSMPMQIKRLADGHRMSKENFPQEGASPCKGWANKTQEI